MLKAWAERVRSRICSISKSMAKMESERQNLLSMLWEAGLPEYEVMDSELVHSQISFRPTPDAIGVPVTESRAHHKSQPTSVVESTIGVESVYSVIDLVSDEDGMSVHIPCDTEAGHDCPPTPLVESVALEPTREPEQVVDPLELSFTLPPAAVAPEPVQEERVFRPWESQSIAWENMGLQELKQWMQFFGMKTTGGRGHMVNQLSYIFRYIGSVDVPVTTTVRSAPSIEEIFRGYTNMVKADKELYERIVLFEHVEISDVYDSLKARQTRDVPVTLKNVKDFLCVSGVQFSNTSDKQNIGRKRVKRKSRRESVYDDDLIDKKKTRRELRRSITCP